MSENIKKAINIVTAIKTKLYTFAATNDNDINFLNVMQNFPVTASTLSEKDLGKFIIETYNLDETSHCQLFRTGVNHTYFISNALSKYAIRVYCYNWRTRREIEEELKLLNLLKEENLSVSFPIADKNGDFIQEINAPEGVRYVVLFSFAEGDKIRFMDGKTCFEIGALMAKIHNTTVNKRLERVDFNRDILIKKSYEDLNIYFNDELDAMKLAKEMGNQISIKFQEFPFSKSQTGIVHLDIWYDNFSVSKENDITIFDFDNCGNGPFILDIGYFCKQLFFIEADKKQYELKKASFLKGYQKHRNLSHEELQVLPEAGAAIFLYYLGVQAQRFDWSNIFLTENYLNMFVGRIHSWILYNEAEVNF